MGGGLGKLKAAARWLLTPAATDDRPFADDPEALDIMRRLQFANVPAPTPAAADADEPALHLWAQHLDAFTLLRAMRTQWRAITTRAGALFVGLDYATLDAQAARYGITLDRDTFEQLQVMEVAGRQVMTDLYAPA